MVNLHFLTARGKKNKLRSGMVFISHCRFSNTLNLKIFLKKLAQRYHLRKGKNMDKMFIICDQ